MQNELELLSSFFFLIKNLTENQKRARTGFSRTNSVNLLVCIQLR